ncbi:MAG: PASTA domain-containing protein [Coriobacteriia bacterium]|nr:PASTA domain-containing protein [Coriobacteriia bacterium]
MSDEFTPETPEQPVESAEPSIEPAAEVLAEQPAVEPATSAQLTAEVAPAPAPMPQMPSGPEPATMPAGSRVVLVVSRGHSPAPPAIPLDMPDVTGELQGRALAKLQAAGFSAQVLHDHSDRLPRGYLLGQYPVAGAAVQPGADVVLLASTGRAQLPTPDVMLPHVVGLDQEVAAQKIAAASLVPRIVYDFDPVAVHGTVLAQIPSEEALTTPVRRRGGKAWLIIALVLLAIAAAGAAIWYLNRPMPIPNLSGLTQSQAEKSVQQAGFALGSVATSQTADDKLLGTVVGQAPNPGGSAAHGSEISLVIAGGQLLVTVPNVVGSTQAVGIKTLQDNRFAFATSSAYSSTVPSGSIIAQSPIAGDKIPPGTTVGLSLSMGPRIITVPNVVAQLKVTAETSLRGSGLEVASASNYDSATPAGQVIGQQPTMGIGVTPGTKVGLTVSRGLPPAGIATVVVPTVVGKTQSKAQSVLRKAKLKTLVVSRAGTGGAKGEVIAQLPMANVIVARYSTVIIFVADGS